MSPDWENLKISQTELDDIFEPNVVSSWAIALSRVSILRLPQYRQSLFLMECSWLLISWLFLFPINLIVFRKLNLLASNHRGLLLILLSTGVISVIFLLILNYYLWQKAKDFKILAKLCQKVISYNHLINNFQLLSNINQIATTKQPHVINDYAIDSLLELKKVFLLTKNSLLNSIELESYIHQQQTSSNLTALSPNYRYQLLLNLEDDLINLSLAELDLDTQYQELIHEAVDLGLSVHLAMRKIKNNRESDK